MKRYEKLYHAFSTIVNWPNEDLVDFVHHIDGRDIHATNLGGSYLIVDHKTDADIMTIYDDQTIEIHDAKWCNKEYDDPFHIIEDMEV